MKLLLDEMYPEPLVAGLGAVGIEAVRVAALGLAGRSDADVFAAAVADGFAVLTENVGDFTRLAADCIARGEHHHGLLIALSSRFSRRPAGLPALVAAVADGYAGSQARLEDRVVYLQLA